jgi:hypothetical protein
MTWTTDFVPIENPTDAAFATFAAGPDITAAAKTFKSPHVRKVVAAIAYRCFCGGAAYAIDRCEAAGHLSPHRQESPKTTDIARLRELAGAPLAARRLRSYGSDDTPFPAVWRSVLQDGANAIEALLTELEATRAQVAGMRTLIEDFIAAEDAVNAEAASCEAQGRAWSSAPLVGRIFAVQALREALSPTPAEKA